MAKRINFFATKNDMISILTKLEEQFSHGLKYFQCGKTERISYETSNDIPGLGTLKEKHSEISFLIMRKDGKRSVISNMLYIPEMNNNLLGVG